MKKILVVSDTHGYTGNLDYVIRENKDVDLMIHLGDVCNDEDYIMARMHCPVKIVRGNNDWSYNLPDKLVLNLEGHRIFATHGHKYNIYYGDERIYLSAMEQDCDIIMYGHTHVPFVKKEDNLLIFNPGSLTYPRQSGHQPSYAVLILDDDGNADCEIKYVTKE